MAGRDHREDPGQYYPGGEVVPKTPTGQGGGGTSDYDQLANKPKINNHELTGNKTAAQLGLAAQSDIPDVSGKLPLRALPKYLHYLPFDDTYPADAAWLYAQLGPSDLGRCSAVRRGGKLWRKYDWTFDDAAEFVVKVYSSASRFGSVGVASIGSRLTENDVMSAFNSRYYKCLPGMTLDGINEKGVVCEINVDGGPKYGWHGDADHDGIHILAAVRWVLDHGETAQQAAEWIADHIIAPQGEMNFHFMVADSTSTYIVENGAAYDMAHGTKVLTNYALFDSAHTGGGKERYQLLAGGADISAVNFTNAYQSGNDWDSDFESAAQHAEAIRQWAAQGETKEAHRGKTSESGLPWWQSVHTTEYDFAAKTMKVAVQEVDDWYTFAVGQANVDLSPIEAQITALQDGKRDKADRAVYSVTRTENTDWTWESDNKELEAALNNGVKLEYSENHQTWAPQHEPDGYWSEPKLGSKEELSVSIVFHDNDTDEQSAATATRPRYMDETLGPAKDDQQLAAVATDDAAKPADGSIMKYDAENDRFVKAVEGVDYIKTHQDISGKRDHGDFEVANGEKSETFGPWSFGGTSYDPANHEYHLDEYFVEDEGWMYTILEDDDQQIGTRGPYATRQTRVDYEDDYTATRSRYVYGPDTLVGAKYVDALVNGVKSLLGSVASGYSTFADWIASKFDTAKAVPEFSQTATYEVGEIVLHDGVAYKCVTAITTAESWTAAHWTAASDADLAARLKMLKSDGTATDQFATDLLEKQVSKAAIVKECLYDEYTVPTTGDDAYDLHANASNLLVFNSSQTSYTFDLSAHLPQKVNGKLMDFFIELNTDAPVTVSTNAADTAKIRGDSPSVSEAGNYWITFSTKADGTIYIRNIKMEAPQS